MLGPIEIGPGSKVGAGSVVVTDLPCHCVAVGVPARIIRQSCVEEPCMNMDLVSICVSLFCTVPDSVWSSVHARVAQGQLCEYCT